MREALKNIFSNQITLEDNSQFYYTTSPYELTNALGNVIAVLQEYTFTKKEDNPGQIFCKLYKTKDGNWYDIEEMKINVDNAVSSALKLAVDNDQIMAI